MARLSGVIERIVFRNEETHYTVARLRPNDDGRLFRSELVTLVGALPGVASARWSRSTASGRRIRSTGAICASPPSRRMRPSRQRD